MKCFYHSADLDGHCSGAIVKREFENCEMFGINYGDEFPWDKIEKDEVIYMVDFSLSTFEEMIELNSRCDCLVWIDHHKSAIKNEAVYLERLNFPNRDDLTISGIREIGIGACFLTWNFMYRDKQPMPFAVQLLAEYDVWNHSNPNTLPFQYGMRLYNTWPENQNFWRRIFENERDIFNNEDSIMDKIIKEGRIVLKYISQYEKRYAKGTYFKTVINKTLYDNYKCIAINKALTSSLLFNSVKTDDIDIMIAFYWSGIKNKWLVSLYSEKVDVSAIAEKFGGGGHKEAAGFTCDFLPFDLDYIREEK